MENKILSLKLSLHVSFKVNQEYKKYKGYSSGFESVTSQITQNAVNNFEKDISLKVHIVTSKQNMLLGYGFHQQRKNIPYSYEIYFFLRGQSLENLSIPSVQLWV